MRTRAAISDRKIIATILLIGGCTSSLYGTKKIQSGTPVVRATIHCEVQFTTFKNKAAISPDGGGIYLDVPEMYSGWSISYYTGGIDEPLEFEVKKAGIVTIAVPGVASDYLKNAGWEEVDSFYTQFNKKWVNVIFEKYMDEGKHELNAYRKGKRPGRILIDNPTPSDTPTVRAKVYCKAQFTKLKNKAATHPDDETDGIFLDVPEVYSGWKISYADDQPLIFKVKKAGIVTISTQQASTGYLTDDGWTEVGMYHTQFDRKWTCLIFEKYLKAGEYELKGDKKGRSQPRPRLLKRN